MKLWLKGAGVWSGCGGGVSSWLLKYTIYVIDTQSPATSARPFRFE
ncbi:MAG: hypothetical protein RQ866_07775 [Bacteroidales bacterium]|nr:hypothetical protein [Bacteroidales bacterium]